MDDLTWPKMQVYRVSRAERSDEKCQELAASSPHNAVLYAAVCAWLMGDLPDESAWRAEAGEKTWTCRVEKTAPVLANSMGIGLYVIVNTD